MPNRTTYKKTGVSVLAIGDRKDYDTFVKFDREARFFLKEGFEYSSIGYRALLSGKFPRIKNGKVIVFLFFPFYYWDKHIEHKKYRGVYGSLTFHKKFIKFCKRLHRILKNNLRGKEVFFINDPVDCAHFRDKVEVKRKLAKSRIPMPRTYRARGVRQVRSLLGKGRNLFVKPRCGSMGKGITYLSWDEWLTNFMYKKKRIVSKRSDRDWHFRNVKGNTDFLGDLVKKDVLIEEAIDTLTVDKMKVDLRLYTFLNKVVYIYPRKNVPDSITTNISQGGKGDPSILPIIPGHMVRKAMNVAEKTSRVLGFNLAGVDVVLDRNLKDVHVVDINAFPGFPKRRTFNITRHIARELKGTLKKEKLPFEKSSSI